jgi:outer membrane immunogenic protein
MRRFAIIGAALLVSGQALAADISAPVYRAPVVVPAYNWSGVYVGGFGGYGTGDGNSTFLGGSIDMDGWFGGGLIGVNYQAVGSPWVFGIEVDSAFAALKGDVSATIAPATMTLGGEITYFGTARGRIGYAWDGVLVYGTGGFAWGKAEVDVTLTAPGISATISEKKTHTGWTAGGGVEWALVDGWTAKVEYLYVALGSEEYFAPGGFDADFNSHTVKLGLNYRFGGGKGPIVSKY